MPELASGKRKSCGPRPHQKGINATTFSARTLIAHDRRKLKGSTLADDLVLARERQLGIGRSKSTTAVASVVTIIQQLPLIAPLTNVSDRQRLSSEMIQTAEHDSTEDARATMDLYHFYHGHHHKHFTAGEAATRNTAWNYWLRHAVQGWMRNTDTSMVREKEEVGYA